MNFKTRRVVPVEILGSGSCFDAPSHLPNVFSSPEPKALSVVRRPRKLFTFSSSSQGDSSFFKRKAPPFSKGR